MKIKITDNVVHKGHVLKKDSIHDLPVREADFLVEEGHATELVEPKPPAPIPPTPPKNQAPPAPAKEDRGDGQ